MSNEMDELRAIEERRKRAEMGLPEENKETEFTSIGDSTSYKLIKYSIIAAIIGVIAYFSIPEKVIKIADDVTIQNTGDEIVKMESPETWEIGATTITAHSTFKSRGRVLFKANPTGSLPDYIMGSLYLGRNKMSRQKIIDAISYNDFTKTVEFPPGLTKRDLQNDTSVILVLNNNDDIIDKYDDLSRGQPVELTGRIVNLSGWQMSGMTALWIDDIKDITDDFN